MCINHPKSSSLQIISCFIYVFTDLQKLSNVQNAIIRRLRDDDLNVIQAALSIGLAGIIDSSSLLRAYREILMKCIHIINGSKYWSPAIFVLHTCPVI